jgi:hypothetical protein
MKIDNPILLGEAAGFGTTQATSDATSPTAVWYKKIA